ncbi:MAG: transposase family protein [Thioploca sp.]|nr:transposase family protein [Thioploca sp.]
MEPKSLVIFRDEMEDTRKAKGKRHSQRSILVLMIMAMLGGKTSLKAIARFAKTHRVKLAECIPLPRGKAPSSSTFQRLSRSWVAHPVCESFNRWMAPYQKPEATAVDGKSITSTVNHATDRDPSFVSLVSLFGQPRQLLYQIG